MDQSDESFMRTAIELALFADPHPRQNGVIFGSYEESYAEMKRR